MPSIGQRSFLVAVMKRGISVKLAIHRAGIQLIAPLISIVHRGRGGARNVIEASSNGASCAIA